MTTLKIKSLLVVITALSSGALVSAALAQDAYIAPRTEWGAPDLQGIWSIATQTRLERAERFNGQLVISSEDAVRIESQYQSLVESSNKPSDPDREAPQEGRNVGGYNNFWMDPGDRLAVVNGEIRTSLLIDPADGRLPLSEAGKANYAAATLLRESYDGPEVRPLGERCVVGFGATAGPPKLPVSYNNITQIVQNEDYVVLLAEMNHDARIVRLNSTFQDPPFNPWLGDSIGYYLGETLIVETTNFHPQQCFHTSLDHRFYTSKNMHVMERFTRVSEEVILYQFTVNDPENYAQPWSGEMPMNSSAEPLYEYACHEGNYAMPGILAGARRAEVDGVPYAPTN